MTRCIVYSSKDGSREGVYFTEDLKISVDDCIPPGCSVDHDFIISDPFPSAFPMEYNLERHPY
jgi:hypothetical protein